MDILLNIVAVLWLVVVVLAYVAIGIYYASYFFHRRHLGQFMPNTKAYRRAWKAPAFAGAVWPVTMGIMWLSTFEFVVFKRWFKALLDSGAARATRESGAVWCGR